MAADRREIGQRAWVAGEQRNLRDDRSPAGRDQRRERRFLVGGERAEVLVAATQASGQRGGDAGGRRGWWRGGPEQRPRERAVHDDPTDAEVDRRERPDEGVGLGDQSRFRW